VVPHAGLVYSGPIAAAAWATLRAQPPATLVLAGTNHYVAGLLGVAVWPSGAWRTPLGDVPVDAALAGRILDLGAPFAAAPEAHLREHSIEVQLPFVARACPGTAIVPLLVSLESTADDMAAGARLGELLAAERAAGRDVALVASSDFAHYPPAAEAEAVTQALLPPLLALDGEELARREAGVRYAGIPGIACGMCGIEPVLFAVAAWRAMGLGGGTLLASGTSADVPGGDPERTVGYAAVAFA
jgi:AmmeMemoRadiSam system protein B